MLKVDKVINQWQPRLRVCIHTSGQHFELLLLDCNVGFTC